MVPDGAGWFKPRSVTVPKQLWEYLNDRASHIMRLMETISPSQQREIADSFRADPDRFLQSGLFRAMQRDVEMFGDDAFSKYGDVQDHDD